jgi:hypothetical protein
LVAPGDLRIEDGHLPFYRENQGVCDWGIAVASLGADDPPVHVSFAGRNGELSWEDEFSSVTEFLCVQGAWQAVQGGLPFVSIIIDTEFPGAPPTDPSLGRKVRAAARRIGNQFVASKGLTAWVIRGCVLAMASDTHFGMASRDAERFIDVSRALGVAIEDWDYATLRDE